MHVFMKAKKGCETLVAVWPGTFREAWIASWNGLGKGIPHLHGHVHLPPHRRIGKGRVMDVGVDGNNLFPISMEDVRRLLRDQPIDGFMSEDHHTIIENYK